MPVNAWAWVLFATVVLGMLILDLRGVHAQGELTFRSAVRWSAAWIGLGLLFSIVILGLYGPRAQLTYLTAYLLEKSLSIDNVFVFALVFSQLRIPPAEQRRVLYWGVLGALVMRGALITAGMYLLDRYHWVTYVFAALIILAALRMLFGAEQERKVVVAACAVCGTWVARILPITPVMRGGRFWVKQGGRLLATPLLIALIIVETTDLVFALDSIPAVFAVTREPFLVYTSNVFAMLGLRSLYFLLAGAVQRFRYLRFGLASVLVFVGAKMLLGDVVEIPTWVSLAFIAVALALAVTVSLGASRGERAPRRPEQA